MKMNDRTRSTMALYRLFLVSYMLKSARIANMGLPHDYPKMMLSHMLVMSYWSENELPIWQLMEKDMYLFNEEMGETYYSILSRCVLGDNIKSNFDHMNKIFTLLPLYKNVKDDISTEIRDKQFALTWHHNISTNADEVNATSFFFKRVINSIIDGKYKSYTFATKYPTIGSCIDSMTMQYVPLVYITDVSEAIDGMTTKIQKALSSNFMSPHLNDWPFQSIDGGDEGKSEGKQHSRNNMENVDDDMYSMDGKHGESDVDDVSWGPPWTECVVGCFAVIRCEIGAPPQSGICVVKVTRKDDENLAGPYPVRLLEGKEYLCTVSNVQMRCVRSGRWNWHNVKSTTDDYDNSSVISYFDRLNDGVLPSHVMHAVEMSHMMNTIFR